MPYRPEWYWKALWWGLVALVVILSSYAASHADPARAAGGVLAAQSDGAVGSGIINNNGKAQLFTPDGSGLLSGAKLYADGFYNNPTNPRLTLRVFQTATTTDLEDANLIATSDSLAVGGTGVQELDFSFQPTNSASLTAGVTYVMAVTMDSGSGDYAMRGSATQFYAAPATRNCTSAYSSPMNCNTGPDGSLHTWQFELDTDDLRLSFTNPVDGSDIQDCQPDGSGLCFWSMRYGSIGTTTDHYLLTITYSRDSGFSTAYTDAINITAGGELVLPPVLKSQPLIFPPLADGVTWYARAELDDLTTSAVTATTTDISFQVFYPGSTGGTTSSSTPSGATGILRAFFARLAKKPPFGYFTAVKTGFEGLATSSPAFDLVNSSTIAAASNIFSPIRTGFEWLIYLLGGFWLYHRLRHLDF